MFGKRNAKPAARCFTPFAITAGIVIYPIAEVLLSRRETKKENRSIIQNISVLSAQHLLYPNGKTLGFAAMPAGKRHTGKTIRRIDIYENVRYEHSIKVSGSPCGCSFQRAMSTGEQFANCRGRAPPEEDVVSKSFFGSRLAEPTTALQHFRAESVIVGYTLSLKDSVFSEVQI